MDSIQSVVGIAGAAIAVIGFMLSSSDDFVEDFETNGKVDSKCKDTASSACTAKACTADACPTTVPAAAVTANDSNEIGKRKLECVTTCSESTDLKPAESPSLSPGRRVKSRKESHVDTPDSKLEKSRSNRVRMSPHRFDPTSGI